MKLGIIYRSVILYLYITFSLDAETCPKVCIFMFIEEFKKGKKYCSYVFVIMSKNLNRKNLEQCELYGFCHVGSFQMNVTFSKSPTFIDVIFHNQYMTTFVISINL